VNPLAGGLQVPPVPKRAPASMVGIIREFQQDCVSLRFDCGPTNAFSTEIVSTLAAAIEDAHNTAKGVLLCGGDKFFSNGVDLPWALTQSSAEMRTLFLELGRCILALLETPLPVVGAFKGHAIGGAMAMLLACDYRYGALGRVLLGKPEILLGVPNPYYGDQLLRFVAGDYMASDLIYTGRLITAEQALADRIIHAVAEKDEVENMAWRQLHSLLALAPQAFSESKRMRSERLCERLRSQMSARVARQVEIWNTPEAQTRLHAAADRLSR
jgi:enoyl-CoA hydratase/carnithine racemase